MKLISLLTASILLASITPNAHGAQMYIESCTLGCSSGAGGAPVFCALAIHAQNADLRVQFSDLVDLASVSSASFRITDTMTGTVPFGSLVLDPNDGRVVIFRPETTFDAMGNPVYALSVNSIYQITIAGQAQGDSPPFVSSLGGLPNQGRLSCSIFAIPANPFFFDRCNGDGGDQSGCTDCPCSNNAPAGTIGGCLNSSGQSSRLLPSGTPSASLDTLRMALSGGTPNSFAILFSANQLAPTNPTHPCFGLGSGISAQALDGLRCAVQSVLRQGTLATDSNGAVGSTNSPWGTTASLIFGTGISSGQTRHYQVFCREDPLLGCMTGQNSSQAVSLTVQP